MLHKPIIFSSPLLNMFSGYKFIKNVFYNIIVFNFFIEKQHNMIMLYLETLKEA